MKKETNIIAEIIDIDFSKIDNDNLADELLRIAYVPIDISTAKRLEALGWCRIKWYEGEWDDRTMKVKEIAEIGTIY